MDLAICIVSYNTRALLLECLDSVQRHAPEAARVVVVDCASSDGSAQAAREAYPAVTVLEVPNRGFGAGCNAGLRATTEPAVLLLNADTRLQPGDLVALLRRLEGQPEAAVVGPRLVSPDGSLQRSCHSFPSLATALFDYTGLSKAFPRSRLLGRYALGWWNHGDSREVDWVSGAALLVRRSAVEQVGGFDEGYYMYAEEADLCFRLRRAGFGTVYEPAVQVVHHLGASTHQLWPAMVMASHRSTLRFFRLHYGRAAEIALRAIVFAGNLARLLPTGVLWLARPGQRVELRERLAIYGGALGVSLGRRG